MSKITLKNFAAMTVSYLQYSLDYTSASETSISGVVPLITTAMIETIRSASNFWKPCRER